MEEISPSYFITPWFNCTVIGRNNSKFSTHTLIKNLIQSASLDPGKGRYMKVFFSQSSVLIILQNFIGVFLLSKLQNRISFNVAATFFLFCCTFADFTGKIVSLEENLGTFGDKQIHFIFYYFQDVEEYNGGTSWERVCRVEGKKNKQKNWLFSYYLSTSRNFMW